MSGFEAALAGAMTAMGVGAVAIGRSWPYPRRRRAPQQTLLPGQISPPQFRDCLVCGVASASTVYPNGAFHCAEGHLTVPRGAIGLNTTPPREEAK